jgi:hypothetical protein
MTWERPIPTFSKYLFDSLIAARLAGEKNLLHIARQAHGDVNLYTPYFYHDNKKYRFFFCIKKMRQDFERTYS